MFHNFDQNNFQTGCKITVNYSCVDPTKIGRFSEPYSTETRGLAISLVMIGRRKWADTANIMDSESDLQPTENVYGSLGDGSCEHKWLPYLVTKYVVSYWAI